MSDKSRLCVCCGRYIAKTVVQAEEGPVHDCGELLAENEQLRERNNALRVKRGWAENERDGLRERNDTLRMKLERLRDENEQLRAALPLKVKEVFNG